MIINEKDKIKKPKAENRIRPVVVTEKSAIDESIEKLISVLQDQKYPDIESIIKNNNEFYDVRIKALAKYLGEKLEQVSKNLTNKPTSFIFDIKRDNDGYIDKVFVKPDK